MCDVGIEVMLIKGYISNLKKVIELLGKKIEALQAKCDHPKDHLNVAVGEVHVEFFEAYCSKCQSNIIFERKKTCVSCYGKMKKSSSRDDVINQIEETTYVCEVCGAKHFTETDSL
ncbi:hypothetical protein ACFL08_00250 [Patescibacteria group bacterium]